LDINGNEFKEMVMRIVRQVLQEQQHSARRLYIVFEDSFDVRYDTFLRSLTGDYEVCAVVPDHWPGSPLAQRITDSCTCCKLIGRTASVDLAVSDSLTVYPVASRNGIVKAALGICDTFETQWFQRCLSAGAAVRLLLSGLEPFTGNEPKPYRERILSYYRILLTYDVEIGFWETLEQLSDARFQALPGEPHDTVPVRAVRTPGRQIITAADIAGYAAGSKVSISAETIITALARERAADKDIQFVTR